MRLRILNCVKIMTVIKVSTNWSYKIVFALMLISFSALYIYSYRFYLKSVHTITKTDSGGFLKSLSTWRSCKLKFTDIEEEHSCQVERFLWKRKDWNTSNLGAVLFLNHDLIENTNEHNKNKTFEVLIWRYYNWLRSRHLKNFGSTTRDPLSNCSVKNCIFTGNDVALSTADAVVIHLQHGLLPSSEKRFPNQRWIFLSDESPKNTLTMSTNKNWRLFADHFNWSMTYRSDSDIPVPYGRVLPLATPIANTSIEDMIPFWNEKRKDVVVAILISSCLPFRMKYIRELSKYVKVHIYGKCSTDFKDSCPGHFRSDCKPIGEYLFYLAFENSKCKEYLSEKPFYHAYSKGAIPIIMGSTVEECDALLPPGSFLHIDNYRSHRELAEHIMYISALKERLLIFHEWRLHYEILNEHGYFHTSSQHFCRICEALNYNENITKIYDVKKISEFLNPDLLCH